MSEKAARGKRDGRQDRWAESKRTCRTPGQFHPYSCGVQNRVLDLTYRCIHIKWTYQLPAWTTVRDPTTPMTPCLPLGRKAPGTDPSTKSRLIPTWPLLRWPSKQARTRSWPLTTSTASSFPSFHITRRTKRGGRTASDTTWAWTSASWKCPGTAEGRGRVTSGPWIRHLKTCSTRATTGAGGA